MGQAPGNQRQHGQVSLHMGSYRHSSLEIQFDQEDLMRKHPSLKAFPVGVRVEAAALLTRCSNWGKFAYRKETICDPSVPFCIKIPPGWWVNRFAKFSSYDRSVMLLPWSWWWTRVKKKGGETRLKSVPECCHKYSISKFYYDVVHKLEAVQMIW